MTTYLALFFFPHKHSQDTTEVDDGYEYMTEHGFSLLHHERFSMRSAGFPYFLKLNVCPLGKDARAGYCMAFWGSKGNTRLCGTAIAGTGGQDRMGLERQGRTRHGNGKGREARKRTGHRSRLGSSMPYYHRAT